MCDIKQSWSMMSWGGKLLVDQGTFELWRPCVNMFRGEIISCFCQSSGITSWSRPTAVSWESLECLALKSNSCWLWHSFLWAGWCEDVCIHTPCCGNLGVLMGASLLTDCFFVLLYQGLDCHHRRAHHLTCFKSFVRESDIVRKAFRQFPGFAGKDIQQI